MQGLISLFFITLKYLGIHPTRRVPIVVEDHTSIVGADGETVEALGIGTVAGEFIPVIEVGTAVPCSLSENFSTAVDGQDKIGISLYRGNEEWVEDNYSLGMFYIVGISDAARETPWIEVIFTVTNQQILLSARDFDNNIEMEIMAVTEEDV